MSGSKKLIEIYKSMTPEERMKKGWELTEWCVSFNPKATEEIERRKQESYSLEIKSNSSRLVDLLDAEKLKQINSKDELSDSEEEYTLE